MRIGDYLKEAGLSLSAFAARAEVSEAAMSRYAAGKRTPRPEIMHRIVAASEGRVQPNDLFAARVETAAERDLLAEVAAVDLLVPDLSGIIRGKKLAPDAVPAVMRNGLAFCASVFALDATGENVEESGLAMSVGDPDKRLVPADGRLLPVPWTEEPTAQMLMTMVEADGTPFYGDPRHVLERVAARFAELRLKPVAALELEFYLVDGRRAPDGAPLPPASPSSGRRPETVQVYSLDDLDRFAALFRDIRRACAAQEVPAHSALSEYAPGQYEVNLSHVADPVIAADHAVLLKRIVKGVARRHGLEATFMAKPYADRVGSGLHVHLSLLDRSGVNLFAGAGDGDADGMTDALRHAIGGLRATMAESMAIFAPNANSYRRLQPGAYAPLAPTWGVDNRTVALRVPSGPAAGRHLEHRVAGADANPYLALAAVLAGVHHGLVERLDPGPPTDGNAYEKVAPSLPSRWTEALARFEEATILPGYFDDAFRRLYAVCKRAEMVKFDSWVSPLEHEWYLSAL